MDWRKEYADRICTAEEAVSHIKSGDRVVVTHACGESVILSDTMVQCAFWRQSMPDGKASLWCV